MSSFSSLGIGLSALLAHRQAAETISQNIANTNTAGYSRRRTEIQSEGAAPVPALYARSNQAGGGVRVEGITRIRDEFLETQHRSEAALGSGLTSQLGVLNRIEGVFPEPSDVGIDDALGKFFGSWTDVMNSPDSEAARAGVLQQAQTVVDRLHVADRELRQQYTDAGGQAKTMVNQINDLAHQVNTCDQAIRAAELAGQSPNDLLDQRDKTVLDLAKLTGATVTRGEYGTVDA